MTFDPSPLEGTILELLHAAAQGGGDRRSGQDCQPGRKELCSDAAQGAHLGFTPFQRSPSQLGWLMGLVSVRAPLRT